MKALKEILVRAVVALAPAPVRESLHGDLLEAEEDVVRECLRSAGPLAIERLRRAGPTRIALALTSGMLAAALVHLAGEAAWRAILDGVPLRADHAPSLSWRLATLAFELAGSIVGAGLVVAARKGNEK